MFASNGDMTEPWLVPSSEIVSTFPYNTPDTNHCFMLQRNGGDIGRTTYAKYENGELNVKISVLLELKKIYNCSFDAFFEGLEEPK